MNNTLSENRDYKFDTMRFLLMYLVIFAHETALFLSSGKMLALYKIIYTFHMPAFMFISGKFAQFNAKRILKHLCLPYVVFQILFVCFDAYLTGSSLSLQFTTPYWILWYLLALIFCYVLIPFLPGKDSDLAFVVLLISFAVSILVGFDTTVGYYLSLSRFFVFLPFFLLGYYQETIESRFKKLVNCHPAIISAICLIVIIVGETLIISKNYSKDLLYGSYAYNACSGSAAARAVILITAAAWICLLCKLIPNRKIPVVSDLGKNSLPVFVLHGFIILLLKKAGFFSFSLPVNLVLACLIALVLYVLLGNPLIAKVFKKLF